MGLRGHFTGYIYLLKINRKEKIGPFTLKPEHKVRITSGVGRAGGDLAVSAAPQSSSNLHQNIGTALGSDMLHRVGWKTVLLSCPEPSLCCRQSLDEIQKKLLKCAQSFLSLPGTWKSKTSGEKYSPFVSRNPEEPGHEIWEWLSGSPREWHLSHFQRFHWS